MELILQDWPAGYGLGTRRRELFVGERFTFVWKSAPPGNLTVTLVRKPSRRDAEGKLVESTAEIIDGGITPDLPGLYVFDVIGLRLEAVAFTNAALGALGTNSAFGQGPLGLRSLINECSADRIIAQMEEAGARLPRDP